MRTRLGKSDSPKDARLVLVAGAGTEQSAITKQYKDRRVKINEMDGILTLERENGSLEFGHITI